MPCVYLPGPAPAVTVANMYDREQFCSVICFITALFASTVFCVRIPRNLNSTWADIFFCCHARGEGVSGQVLKTGKSGHRSQAKSRHLLLKFGYSVFLYTWLGVLNIHAFLKCSSRKYIFPRCFPQLKFYVLFQFWCMQYEQHSDCIKKCLYIVTNYSWLNINHISLLENCAFLYEYKVWARITSVLRLVISHSF
jgi:hypothetical protein